MKTTIKKQDLLNFCKSCNDIKNINKQLLQDNNYYCDILDAICDYLTEQYGDEISEENTSFEISNDNILVSYEFL